ncbi:MAG: iron export ABC transporter permease subunit FetB [Rhodospirillales bacterium]|nr:iron export ABC transporter permease subunit FetB [Rhodospirillales bacterium]
MPSYIALSYGDLALAAVLVLVDGALSLLLDLDIHRQLLVATLRMVVQLALMGVVLTALFRIVSPFWTAVAGLVMVGFAGREIVARQERRLAGFWAYGLGTVSMMVSATLVTILALTTAIRPQPWFNPRYAIPLLGMILGNAMTGISLGLNAFTTGLSQRRPAVEAQLMLGATRRQALGPVVRQSLRSALMPTINAMSAMGLVSLPGMMTGQILGGVAPAEAVRYQLLIMFLIAGGTGIGAVAAVMAGLYRLTDARHRLRLDRLRSPAR